MTFMKKALVAALAVAISGVAFANDAVTQPAQQAQQAQKAKKAKAHKKCAHNATTEKTTADAGKDAAGKDAAKDANKDGTASK